MFYFSLLLLNLTFVSRNDDLLILAKEVEMEDVEVVDGAPRKAGLNLKPMFQTKSTSKYQLKGSNNNKLKDNKSKEDRFIEKIVKMKVEQPNGGIIETPTTCYGNLEFKGATRRSRAKVRISTLSALIPPGLYGGIFDR